MTSSRIYVGVPALDGAVPFEHAVVLDRLVGGIVPARFEVTILLLVVPGAELPLDNLPVGRVMNQSQRASFPGNHGPSFDTHSAEPTPSLKPGAMP
jgi:hypothetical protein